MNYGLFLDLDHTHIDPFSKRWIGSKDFWFNLHQSLQEKGRQNDLNVIPVIVTFRSELGNEGRTMFRQLHRLFPNDPATGVTYDIYELDGATYYNPCCLVRRLFYNPIDRNIDFSMHYELVDFDPKLPLWARSNAVNATHYKTLPLAPRPHVVLCNTIQKSKAIRLLMNDWGIKSTDYSLMLDDDPYVITDMKNHSIPYVAATEFHPVRYRYIGDVLIKQPNRGLLSLHAFQISHTLDKIKKNCHQHLDKAIETLNKRPDYLEPSAYPQNSRTEPLPNISNFCHTRQPFSCRTSPVFFQVAPTKEESQKEEALPKLGKQTNQDEKASKPIVKAHTQSLH